MRGEVRHIPVLFAGILVASTLPGFSQPLSKRQEEACSHERAYQKIKGALSDARAAIAQSAYRQAGKLLDIGISRLESYTAANQLSLYHDPDLVVLDDTGLNLNAAYEFEKKQDWRVAAEMKASVLEVRLHMVCHQLNYKYEHTGVR